MTPLAPYHDVLAVSVWRVPARGRPSSPDGSGLRALLTRPRLAALLALTFVFYLLYGPVEVAVPARIAADLHRPAGAYGACWTAFAISGLAGAWPPGWSGGCRCGRSRWAASNPCCHDQGAFSILVGLGRDGVSSVE
ncbi:MAG: hypothetical protein ACJ73S_19775 [Mycobacteriales bacterium]